MLKKSNRISLEEATRLAILGKLPLKENKEVKKESTTVTTTPDGLTAVETDDANIVIEPKDNAAVDIGMGAEPVCEPECAEEPVEDIPMEEPIDEPIDEEPVEEFDESKKIEGKEPKRKVISKHDIKKIESKEHKLSIKENRIRGKKTESIEVTEITYIDTFDELVDFCWGEAASSTLDEVERLGKEDELMDWLEEVTMGQVGSTELNDIIAYDDSLEQALGLFDYADEDEEDLDESKKVEGCKKDKKEEGNAELFKKKINKTDIKKVENKKVEEGNAELFKKKINKTDIKKVEAKDKQKRNIINKVDLRKVEAKKTGLNDRLKTRVAEGLSKFVKESYKNGKEVKVERLLNLTEGKLYVQGKLVMENSRKDFSCKLVPIKENKTFRVYTINENKLLKITEGKTVKGKSFNLVVKK